MLFFNTILNTYFSLINEDSKFIKNGSYKNIDFYFSLKHIKERNKERYFNNISLKILKIIISRFLKELINENYFNTIQITEKSFTIHTILSNIWLCGRLKKNFGKWRIEIFTLLPNNNPYYNKQDLFKELNI